ncbi:dTTP/UTP pyrophosphatase [Dirofilaria immitis]
MHSNISLLSSLFFFSSYTDKQNIYADIMNCNSYSKLMPLWGIDRIDSRRGFRWKVIFPRFFTQFHFDKDSTPIADEKEMAYTTELAKRMANFVLEDDFNMK